MVKLSEIEARFNQRSNQIEADLAEIAAQEARATDSSGKDRDLHAKRSSSGARYSARAA